MAELTEAQRRELMTTQAELVALTKHPSWPTLERVVADRQEKMNGWVLALAFNPGGLDQRRCDYYRGFHDGLAYILAVGNGAETRLEDVLKKNTSNRRRSAA